MSAELTIEQLASASGMSVRNIRAHQARGLLEPPDVRMRVGYYGDEHVSQLKLIRDLQADGFNLAGIKRLLEDGRGTAERLTRVRAVLSSSRAAETPEMLTLSELGRRFEVEGDRAPEVLARAERLGILIPAGPERFLVPSPTLLTVAEQVVARGISLDGALAVFEQVERHCDAVSAAFVRLFMEQVWRPFEEAGMPEDRWAEMDESVKALRPLAAEALQAILGQRMSAQIDAAFGELTQRLQAADE
ncbi:MAG: MerR family transcriptional regulator [Solirubrobacteraceae bacterium]